MCNNSTVTPVLKAHFLNVGQALSVLVHDEEGNSLLYDAGNNGDADFIIGYIKDQGIEKIDVMVCSHPHEDHIGGIDAVMNAFPVGTAIMSNKTYGTKTYSDVISALITNNIAVSDPEPGMILPLGAANIQIIGPHSPEYDDTNNYSVVVKVTAGDHSLLLPGDAEAESEHEILESNMDITSDIISVSHHGSYSSNTIGWLNKAMKYEGVYCIISTGTGNRYNHPDKDILKRLKNMDATIRRTDREGTMIYTFGGDSIREEIYPFVGSTGVSAGTYSELDPIQVIISELDKVQEYVVVKNIGNRVADMSGWTMMSERGNQRLIMPQNTYLGPNETFRFTAGKANGSGDFEMSNRHIWSNSKEDQAVLLDGQGNEVDRKL